MDKEQWIKIANGKNGFANKYIYIYTYIDVCYDQGVNSNIAASAAAGSLSQTRALGRKNATANLRLLWWVHSREVYTCSMASV